MTELATLYALYNQAYNNLCTIMNRLPADAESREEMLDVINGLNRVMEKAYGEAEAATRGGSGGEDGE